LSTPECRAFIPITQVSSLVFRTEAPPPRQTPSTRHRRLPPSDERPPSCSIPQLTAASSPLGLPRAAGPLNAHRRPPELPRRRPTPFAPPHCRHTVLVRLCPLLLARHLPCAPLEISGNTLRPASAPPCRPAHGVRVVTKPAHTRCSGPRRPFSPLGWAARPWPSWLSSRPHVAGHRALWAVALGRFWPSTVPGDLNVFQLF
jgi:hypothetical protein